MKAEQLDRVEIFYKEAYPLINQWCDAVVGQFGTGCQIGCSACCNNVLSIHYIEAMVLLNDPGVRQEFFVKRGMVASKASLFLSRSPETKLKPWAKKKVPCVFLSDDNQCLVYDRRPFNCRTHIAVKSCKQERDGNLYFDASQVIQAGLRLIQIGSEEAGIPFAIAPMPVALLIADALLSSPLQKVKEAYRGLPLFDPFEAAQFWSYIEM